MEVLDHAAADRIAREDGVRPGLIPHVLPLGATDAAIDRAAREARLLPLLMSVVHMSGDLAILEAAGRTSRPTHSTDATGGLPEERQRALRAMAADAIRAWRDAGCPAPHRPDEETLRSMIDTLVGAPLDRRYESLLAEELGLYDDPRAFRWNREVSEAEKARLPVLIVGAGLSGLVMAYRLGQAGIPYTLIEKNDGPGGTWFENRFPGARVDVPSHCYSFSFTRDQRWPALFSPWPVLRSYFAEFPARFGIEPHVRYGTRMVRATWDERASEWEVLLRSDSGGDRTERVAAVISAVGQLNQPLIPVIEGEDDFRGTRVHTSRWSDELPVAGRKVVVIGTAATALQLVPELAREAASLTVFQRSPTWVLVHPEYRSDITAGEQWAMDHLPGYARWYRTILYNWALDGSADHMTIDPDWTGGDQAVSAANEAARVRLTAGMKAAIGDDPALWSKFIPTYPPFVKRPNLGDGGFYRAFSQPHVRLCTDGVARFTETGVVDGAGVHHEADLVVYATGFKALDYLAPMEILGRDGQRIDRFWGDEPRAYLGITVRNFPNLFLMYGPGTNLGFNGNLFFNSECQARYIAGCLRWMVEDGLDAIEVRGQVYDDYAARMDAALARFTWSHGGAGSWYKNKAGKVIANSPWPLVQYWEWTREPDRGDFAVTRARAPADAAVG